MRGVEEDLLHDTSLPDACLFVCFFSMKILRSYCIVLSCAIVPSTPTLGTRSLLLLLLLFCSTKLVENVGKTDESLEVMLDATVHCLLCYPHNTLKKEKTRVGWVNTPLATQKRSISMVWCLVVLDCGWVGCVASIRLCRLFCKHDKWQKKKKKCAVTTFREQKEQWGLNPRQGSS